MAMPDEAFDALADRFGEQVAQRASEAFELMWRLLQGDTTLSPREAVLQAQQHFGEAFTGDLAIAFSEMLTRTVGTAELLAMPVGDVVLSRRLYLHNEQTAGEVAALVRQHAQGVQQARELALRLYDGYDPRDGLQRPLEGAARAELPRALRELTADPAARASLEQLVEQGQAQAARLRSRALRAAYSEAFDAWERGAGRQALKRKLDVAQREKNRFMADRIAQTELARAHQAQVGAELMADETIDVVQVLLNPTHPRRDICDLFGRADLWGLGPGCYPKREAPRPAFHPFCRCKLRSRPSLLAAAAIRRPGGEAAYLRGLEPDEAAAVMGSAERAQRVMSGAPLVKVVDAGRPEAYRLARLGDGTAHPLLKNAGMRPHPKALPNHDRAVIADAKLAAYALNPDHPKGGDKAKVFDMVMGFTRENRALLEQAVRAALPYHPAEERPMKAFGREFTVDLPLSGPKGNATVRTAWMIDNGSDVPRLTSVYVKKR